MPVVPMAKVAVIGHLAVKEQVLKTLQRLGIIELIAPPADSLPAQESSALELELTELEFAINMLGTVSGRKKSFIESFAPYKEPVTAQVLESAVRESDWRGIVARLKDYEARLANLKKLASTLRTDIALLSPWQELDQPLDQLVNTDRCCFLTAVCKVKDLALIKARIAGLFPAALVEPVRTAKEKAFVLIVYPASTAALLRKLLQPLPLETVSLPATPRTPKAEIAQLQRLLVEAQDDQAKITGKIRELLRHQTSLTYVYDQLFQQHLSELAAQKLSRTEKTFALTGWIARGSLPQITAELERTSPLAAVQEVSPEKGETPPTLIRNHPVFYPFEMITRIFGLPAQHEIDPTGPLSFFYLFFFAVCLSDVGYGIMLAAAAYYYLRTLTLSEGGKKLLLLLFWGGIMTILVGIATGSYFSIDIKQLPPLLQRLQIIDPIKNPLNVLLLSLAIGVFQNLTGIAVSFYWKVKNRDYLNAFCDDALWFFFLSVLVGYAVTSALAAPASGLFARLAMSGALLLLLTQGRSETGIIKKALFGLLSLYRTTSYLGDTLSYSRLLALMMTTSIIGLVVNIIASLVRDSVPVLGYLLMIVILVGGHIFNLVVSVLGAFIHAARLQLVEFFGKFYLGGGREFQPFRRQTRYVIIE
jgi:V/A-type H+-transporting ATPase subunit I